MLTFRKLQNDDINELKKLFKITIQGFSWFNDQQKKEIFNPYKTDRFNKILGHKDYICVLGFMDKKIVSFTFGYHFGGVFHLQWIGVFAEFQNKGIAKKMLQKLFSYCHTKHCHKIVIEIVSLNQASIALFKSAGFTKYATLENYFYHKEYHLFQKSI